MAIHGESTNIASATQLLTAAQARPGEKIPNTAFVTTMLTAALRTTGAPTPTAIATAKKNAALSKEMFGLLTSIAFATTKTIAAQVKPLIKTLLTAVAHLKKDAVPVRPGDKILSAMIVIP
jgi:hypothetical protein